MAGRSAPVMANPSGGTQIDTGRRVKCNGRRAADGAPRAEGRSARGAGTEAGQRSGVQVPGSFITPFMKLDSMMSRSPTRRSFIRV